MHCNEVEKWIGSLADNEISSLIKKDVETHVRDCWSCGTMLQNTLTVKATVKNALPFISPPSRLDANVINAFYTARARREASKTSAWRGVFPQRINMPKPIFALLTLLSCVLLGLAFQLGRVSVSPQLPTLFAPAPSAHTIQIPVEKIVEIPVIKEKTVTRYVYVKKQDSNRVRSIGDSPQTDKLELSSVVAGNGYITQTSLKGFQPASEIKIGVRKGSKDNEK